MKRTKLVLMASICAIVFLLVTSIFSLLNAAPAHAASTFDISRVWTRTCQGQDATIFVPGQCIQYMVSVDNALGKAVEAQFIFDAYPTGPYDYSSTQIYYWNSEASNTSVSVPVGMQYYYSQPDIPQNASTGDYTFKITVITKYPAPAYSVTQTTHFTIR
jgi:hypothetical protein